MWSTNLIILLLSTGSIAKPKFYDTSIHWVIEDRFPDDIEGVNIEEVNTEAAKASIPLPESGTESNLYTGLNNQGKTTHILNGNNNITMEGVPIWKLNKESETENTLESAEDELIFDKEITVPIVNAKKAIATMSNTITERLPTINSNKQFVRKDIAGSLNAKRYLVADKNDVSKSNNATKDIISATDVKKDMQRSYPKKDITIAKSNTEGESVEEVNVTRKHIIATKNSIATIAKNGSERNFSKEDMNIIDKVKIESNTKKEIASKKPSDSFKIYFSLDGDEVILDDRGIFDIVDNCSSDQVYDKNLGRCMGLRSAEVAPEDDFSNLLIFT